MPSEVRKYRHLEEENPRLRKLVADLTLDKEMLTEVGKKSSRGGPRAPDERACPYLLPGVDPARVPGTAGVALDVSVPVDTLESEPLRQRIREIALTHAGYGYRRVHIVLEREG